MLQVQVASVTMPAKETTRFSSAQSKTLVGQVLTVHA